MAPDVGSVLKQAAATPRRELSMRELEAWARRSKLMRAATTLTVAGVITVTSATFVLGNNGSPVPPVETPNLEPSPSPTRPQCRQIDIASDEYGTEINPTTGPPGTEVTFSGRTLRDQNGRWAPSDRLEAWWNTRTPGEAAPIKQGPAFRLVRVDVMETCRFEATFTVPEVAPGTYRISVFSWEEDPADGYGFHLPHRFTVTDGEPDVSGEHAPGWTELADAPEVRATAATAWGDGRLFVWGGYVYSGYGDEISADDGFFYDLATDSWSPLPEAPLSARSGAAGTWTGQEFLVWGGLANTDGSGRAMADGAAFDPVGNEWRTLPPAPIGGRAPLSVWTGEEMIVWGSGMGNVGDGTSGAAYDPAEDSWRRISDSPFELGAASAVWTGEEMIVIGEGLIPTSDGHAEGLGGLAYDPTTDEWRQLPRPPFDEGNAATASWNGTEVIVWHHENETAAYDPISNTWRRLEDAPLREYECAPQSVSVGYLVFGDYCGSTIVFDTTDDSWTRIQGPSSGPGWGLRLVAADDFVFLLGRNVDTTQEFFNAYKP